MPAKIESEQDIVFLDRVISHIELAKHIAPRTIQLAPLIETAKAVQNVDSIAQASDRLTSLCLGGEDYLNDIGTIYTYQESALVYPRAKLVNAARANGLLPIDTPYLKINDMEGFRKSCSRAYRDGFAGNLILTPKQIMIANKTFLPNEEEVQKAEEVLRCLSNQQEAGVKNLEGQVVGPPMEKRAKNVWRQIHIGDYTRYI